MSGFSQRNNFLADNAILKINNSYHISNGKVIEFSYNVKHLQTEKYSEH